ncbi:hypothetical protein ACHAXR_009682 [Thalassiosira sp. AJA248-18]
MSSSKDAWFDPRLTVFIIWGIFVVLFICIPSKRVVQRIFYLMGCTCCGYDEDAEIAPSNTGDGNEVSYEILSSARKQEIDGLRASHLTYRLHPFTLTLEKKHMLRRISESGDESPSSSLPQDRKPDPQSSHSNDDVETGFVRGIDPPERDGFGGDNKEEEDGVQYTHVSVPMPGHNFDCVDVHKSKPCTEDEKKDEKKSKIRIFGGKAKEEVKSDTIKEEPTTAVGENNGGGNNRRRSCPIFCAICLMEYEPPERVSWSSNPECTHIFHEDCVVQWLVSLGRTKSKNHRFSVEPTEAQLLNYQLECPCCRQEFISREKAALPELSSGSEENV